MIQPLVVTSSDGTRLRVDEAGDPSGPSVVFLHGFTQCRLAWLRQMRAAELQGLRLLAVDLRGHGDADKPHDAYDDPGLWADDINAVIAGLSLARPTLVAWSYAGIIACHYLRVYGGSRLAGVNLVGAMTGNRPDAFAEPGSAPDYLSDDATTCVNGLTELVRASVHGEMAPADLRFFVGCAVWAPSRVRAALLRHAADNRDLLPQLATPALVTHGSEDAVVPLRVGERHAAAIPAARLSVYDGVGHMPFWEDAPRFNRELLDFVAATA